MAEEKKEPVVIPEEVTQQIDNLNKGIASYRDKATAAEKAAADALKIAEEAKSELEKVKKNSKNEPDVQLNPEDEKKLKAWAEANGFVTKIQLEEEKGRIFNESLRNIESQAIDEFLKSHPEYDDEAEWEKVKTQFNLYKQPTSITAYRQLLSRIHKELKGSEETEAKIRAAEETKKRLGLGGGSQGDATHDKTLESLQERYPNLSTDQIQARLQEINSLAEARKQRNTARK